MKKALVNRPAGDRRTALIFARDFGGAIAARFSPRAPGIAFLNAGDVLIFLREGL